jgi:hypothetical protein
MTNVKDVASKRPSTGGITGKGFLPGKSGNPSGRAAVPPEVRAALEADTLEHYSEAKRIIAAAEASGDLKTALHGRLALLKKTVPDATELVISMPDGLTMRSITIDPRKLTETQLAAVHAAVTAAEAK